VHGRGSDVRGKLHQVGWAGPVHRHPRCRARAHFAPPSDRGPRCGRPATPDKTRAATGAARGVALPPTAVPSGDQARRAEAAGVDGRWRERNGPRVPGAWTVPQSGSLPRYVVGNRSVVRAPRGAGTHSRLAQARATQRRSPQPPDPGVLRALDCHISRADDLTHGFCRTWWFWVDSRREPEPAHGPGGSRFAAGRLRGRPCPDHRGTCHLVASGATWNPRQSCCP
jgi:hypothetical protein